jgi:hypothetical protein
MTGYHNDATAVERIAVQRNDERVRKGGATYHGIAVAEADAVGGRFAARERSTVIGAAPAPRYPTLPESLWGNQGAAVPPEPPLGVAVDQMDPVGEAFEIEKSLREMRDEADPPSAPLPVSPNDEGRAPLGGLLADASRRPRRLSRHKKG